MLFSKVGSNEFALCKSPSEERLRFDKPLGLSKQHKRYSLERVTEKSDNVGLNLSSNRLVGLTYRLVAIQRRRPHIYEVKYSALYFT